MNDRQLGDLALAAAELGSAAILRELRNATITVQDKAPEGADYADVVTNADKAAEDAILTALLAVRPQDAVLAEESGARHGDSGLCWVVDPLDGTMNFVHGRRDYAVSVGAERDQRPVAGAVVRPADGDWAFAAGDAGVGRDGPLRVSRPSGLGKAIVGLGMPRPSDERDRVHKFLGELLPQITDYRRGGSSACSLLDVAYGREDLCLSFGVSPWDVSGGAALVHAAGGRAEWATTGSGLRLFVAGGPELVDQILEQLEGI